MLQVEKVPADYSCFPALHVPELHVTEKSPMPPFTKGG